MNEITISMDKKNHVQINNRVPVACTVDQAVTRLSGLDFAMVRFEFDNRCYGSATDELRTREYNTYMRRASKIAQRLGLEVLSVERKVIKGYEMPFQWVAVAAQA